MSRVEIQGLHRSATTTKLQDLPLYEYDLAILFAKEGVRPYSFSVEDAFFGDSGKGSVIAKFNNLLVASRGRLITIRFNGGANAGHETVMFGKTIVTHQLPMGVIQEGATSMMTRGMVIHPEDLLTELETVEIQCGGSIPGKLIIDERATFSLDTHRALEGAVNEYFSGGNGSTGSGIAPAYEDFYGRHPVSVKDLMDDYWREIFTQHYLYYQKLMQGLGYPLEETQVNALGQDNVRIQKQVGNLRWFLDILEICRKKLSPYVSSEVYEILDKTWRDSDIPITIEGAQGAGLDPYHGVFPDVTASRTMTSNIHDSTEGIIIPREIAVRVAAMKTTYMTSVGIRKLPTDESEAKQKWEDQIQREFDERGRTTKRWREVYEVSIPIGQYLRRVAGYDYLVATHLDASKENEAIKVVSHYTKKVGGKEAPYRPYQDYLDTLEPHFIEFPGWDGEAIKQARNIDDLPENARRYLAFLGESIAPVILGTSGPNLENCVSMLRGL